MRSSTTLRLCRRVYSTRSYSQPALAYEPTVNKLGGRAAWKGDELLSSKWWGYELGEVELAELDSALQHAKGSGLEVEDEVPLNMRKEVSRSRSLSSRPHLVNWH